MALLETRHGVPAGRAGESAPGALRVPSRAAGDGTDITGASESSSRYVSISIGKGAVTVPELQTRYTPCRIPLAMPYR